MRLGELYLRQGRLAEAEEPFRRLLQRYPDHGRAHLDLARLGPVINYEVNNCGKFRAGFDRVAYFLELEPAEGDKGPEARNVVPTV